MTDHDIVNLFEQHHPSSLEQMQALGLNLEFVASGGNRKVYRLGQALAVKIGAPFNGEFHQTANEIKGIQKIYSNPRLESYHKHILPLFYGNADTGVIVTKFYPGEVKREWESDEKFNNLMQSLKSIGINDLFYANFRQDVDGTLVAVDLGFYHDREEL